MKLLKLALIVLVAVTLTNCASGYKAITPERINYVSKQQSNNVTFEYKYDILDKKYRKKEYKKGIKMVAVKISNNSGRDLRFGSDIIITKSDGIPYTLLDHNVIYSKVRQEPASYLLYLLLTPINLYTYTTNSYGVQETTSSTPIGVVLGPGLAGGNMVAASSANKKFKNDLLNYNIVGSIIKNGETKYGLIGIPTYDIPLLKLVVQDPAITSN